MPGGGAEGREEPCEARGCHGRSGGCARCQEDARDAGRCRAMPGGAAGGREVPRGVRRRRAMPGGGARCWEVRRPGDFQISGASGRCSWSVLLVRRRTGGRLLGRATIGLGGWSGSVRARPGDRSLGARSCRRNHCAALPLSAQDDDLGFSGSVVARR